MSVKWAEYFDLIGLALNVLGIAVIFLFAYPSQDETRRSFQTVSLAWRSCSCFAVFSCRPSPHTGTCDGNAKQWSGGGAGRILPYTANGKGTQYESGRRA